MNRDLGVDDCARLIVAMQYFADDALDDDEADAYQRLAELIAAADRVVIVTRDEEPE